MRRTRREFLGAALAAAGQAGPPKSQLGIAITCYLSYWRPRDPFAFLEHCAALGAGGMQSVLPEDPARFRARLEHYGMYFEAMLPLGPELATAIRRARDAGAVAGRVGALSGRRYETFSSLADWQAWVAEARAKIADAARLAEAERFPLALENHKDWTLEDALGLMREFGGEYFGLLVDTGNNLSLLDDPYEVVEKLAPYARSTHLKDMAWQAHPLGFEMSEMVFGEGLLDMKRIIETLRRARAATKLTLEMITRDPLVVPVLTPQYWATMPDRPAVKLAAMLNRVHTERPRQPLPRMDALDEGQRRRLENDNVKACLHVARERYGL